MKIAIGSDKAGYPLKQEVLAYLVSCGHQVDDLGLTDPDGFKAYYDVAPILAEKISDGTYEKGILMCGTGAGMAIVANKFKGVFAVCVESAFTAKMATLINQCNVLTMGAWVVGPRNAQDMLDRWLGTVFAEGADDARRTFLTGAVAAVRRIDAEKS